jgi:pSer/pThr/pTyr-binding forkhead associated (FHA) protein
MNGFRIVMTKGPQPGQTFSLEEDSLIIGRDPTSDVTVNHPQVSRQHARLIRQGKMLVLEDLGSTNGTFVNGVRLTAPHTLSNGDVIGLGDSVAFTFYGPAVGAEDTIVSRPGAPMRPPDTVVTPSRSTPPPAPAYRSPPPPPAYTPEEKEMEEQDSEPRQRTGLLIGCGVVVLLLVLACIAVFVLDQLDVLPDIFYQPLFWLGILP